MNDAATRQALNNLYDKIGEMIIEAHPDIQDALDGKADIATIPAWANDYIFQDQRQLENERVVFTFERTNINSSFGTVEIDFVATFDGNTSSNTNFRALKLSFLLRKNGNSGFLIHDLKELSSYQMSLDNFDFNSIGNTQWAFGIHQPVGLALNSRTFVKFIPNAGLHSLISVTTESPL